MKYLACAWLVLAALACAGDSPSEPAPGTFGAACTTVTDTGSTECQSGVCTNTFDMAGHPVCSVKCATPDASNCPAGADGTMKCNMKGYCKP